VSTEEHPDLAWRPDWLLGARHDYPDQTGALLDSEPVPDLDPAALVQGYQDRAGTAEAKLAAITSLCQERIDRYMANDPRGIGARFPDDAHVQAADILAIISGEAQK
jgi:hypothetical protein